MERNALWSEQPSLIRFYSFTGSLFCQLGNHHIIYGVWQHGFVWPVLFCKPLAKSLDMIQPQSYFSNLLQQFISRDFIKSISIMGSLFSLELTSDLSSFFEFYDCYHPMRMKQDNQSACLNSKMEKLHAQLIDDDWMIEAGKFKK